MYFFAHLYYTDIVSITAVLGLVLFNMKNEHNIAALFGKIFRFKIFVLSLISTF